MNIRSVVKKEQGRPEKQKRKDRVLEKVEFRLV